MIPQSTSSGGVAKQQMHPDDMSSSDCKSSRFDCTGLFPVKCDAVSQEAAFRAQGRKKKVEITFRSISPQSRGAELSHTTEFSTRTKKKNRIHTRQKIFSKNQNRLRVSRG